MFLHDDEANMEYLASIVTKSSVSDQNRVLHMATAHGKQAYVVFMLNMGVNVDGKDEFGRTALFTATVTGNISLMSKFIDYGANMLIKDKKGMTPLHWAIMKEQLPAVDFLWDKGGIVDSGLLLQFATERKKYAELEMMLKKGINNNNMMTSIFVDDKDENGRTSLFTAALMGNVEAITLLLHYGADVAARDKDKMTSLHWAASQTNLEAVEILFNNNADIEAKDKERRSPLHVATASDNVHMFRHLIRMGASMWAEDQHGMTVMLKSAMWEHNEILQFITMYGLEGGEPYHPDFMSHEI
jgi:ankyrin repeat protein